MFTPSVYIQCKDMSAKGEKCEQALSPKSRVLKKARSFRDDIRSKIARRSSSAASSSSMPSSPRPVGKSPRHRRKAVHRAGSFSEGAQPELLPTTRTNVERLQQKSHKVFQSLHYVQDAVDKSVLTLLPGSITVVLETILELNQLLGNYFIDQDSTVMMSKNKLVYLSLANLIKWADELLLHNKSELDKGMATDVIKAVNDGIQDLVRLSTDKLQKRDSHSKPANIKTSVSEMPHRSSLPDIPLTPREKEILKETSVFPANNISKSSENIVDNGEVTIASSDEPPPKPPRPEHLHSLLASARLQEDPGVPPPLPAKQRTASNVFVFDTNNHSDLSGQSTPTNMSSPHRSLLVATMNNSTSETAPSGDQLEISASAVSRTTTDSRYSCYDNFDATNVCDAGAGIHDLTARIERLTSDIDPHRRVTAGGDVTDSTSPPPLPAKRTSRHPEKAVVARSRVTSVYDNTDSTVARTTQSSPALVITRNMSSGVVTSASAGVMRSSHSLTSPGFRTVLLSSSCTTTMQVTLSKETFSSTETFSSMGTEMFGSSAESLQKPPPLPPKKRHVEAYVQMLGNYVGPGSLQEFNRHSVHSINFYHSQWQRHQMELFQPCQTTRSNTMSVLSDLSNHSSDIFSTTSESSSDDSQMAMLMWKPPRLTGLALVSGGKTESASRMSLYDNTGSPDPADMNESKDRPAVGGDPVTPVDPRQSIVSEGSPSPCDLQNDSDSDFSEMSTLDDIEVSDQLVKKQHGEEGPEIRGGTIDALIVHATTANKHDFMFQEAFLTTYRTFITPRQLLQKLLYRYNRFSRINDPVKKKLSRNAFSFVIRMLDELCTELDEGILRTVMDLVYQLLCDGELMLARILRNKVLEKCECRRNLQQASHNVALLTSYQLTVKTHRLMDFKSEQVAEQMTLLDADLFHKIDIPEVLLWSKEQSEEYSPNLAKFTEHFNKMSYWCRSRILEQEDPRERERYFIKLIKIMKHLRKFNNFNSYLAVLSAVDSAPIRRLEWQKQNLEVLREFCQLIDSSSSFRAYRQALAETEAPCIPYIGLVLQDLTFVHIGNPDLLSDDCINFAKRWQQFQILDNMRRFKKCNYEFRKNEKIISYFNNFDSYLCEESLWQISESIKPRGRTPKKQHDS